jgi:hypothetical protein
MSWEVELQWKSKNVVWLVDSYATHPHLDCLKNIHLEFLPPSTTSLVQPVNMGILKSLETYHRKLVNYILEATKENLLISSTGREDSASVNLLKPVQFVPDSW